MKKTVGVVKKSGAVCGKKINKQNGKNLCNLALLGFTFKANSGKSS
jgi:hypothetical protein